MQVSALPRCIVAAAVAMWGIAAAASGASLGTWKPVNSGTTLDFEAVAFGNNTFVAVGENGLIMTSQDGVKWTKRSAGISRTFNDVTFSGSRFIAVCKAPDAGVGAKIWVSDDNGASWKYRDTDANGDTISVGLHAVAGDGSGNLVAVGGLGWITRSNDNGQTWQVLTTRFTTTSLYGVARGGGVWVATGPSGVFRSTDATAWTPATQSFAAYKAGFGNNRFVVTSYDFGAGFKSSSDGNNWTQCTKAAAFVGDGWPGYSNGVAFGDGIFVVSGGNGDLWTSETGLVWKRWASPLTGTQLQGAAFGQRMFLSAGYDGRMVSSPPWMKERLGSSWDFPFTVFDAEDGLPRRIGLPEYRVNTASLNLVLEATIFYMPTLGVPVNLRLVYASAPTEDGADTIGLFGKNWRFRYESMIGQFGAEAEVITGGGRKLTFGTPKGEDLATVVTPVVLVPPAGIFDTLTFYPSGPKRFELKEKVSRVTYRYDVAGGPGNAIWRLTRITDRSGNQLNFNVTAANGRINSITDASGRSVTFTYNIDNLCTGISVPGSRSITFNYDWHKNLTGITDMAGFVGSYTYDDLGFLLRMNTSGRVNSFTYVERPGYEEDSTPPDGEGAGDKCLASVRNAQGGVVKYELLPKDGGVKRTDARGETMTFKSKAGQTSQVTDPLGGVRTLQYSDAKIPTSFTDELGNTTQYEYDARGNITRLTDALGNATIFTYDARDNSLTRTNALGKTWTYTYDASDRVLTVRSPLANTTTFTYFAANGRLNTVRDARGATTTFANDAYGNLTTTTDPLAGVTTLGYDAQGLHCTTMTDPRGKVKTLAYDANDRLTRVTYSSATGAPARVNGYDAIGQTSFTDELGNITRVLRNDFGFPTQITDPLGHIARTEYDPNNNPVKVTDPLGRVTTTTYDDMNRPLVFTDARGKTITREYDDAGYLASITDKRKNKTRFEYDANHRLIKTIDPLGKTVSTARDALGRAATITNARGQQIRFTYDDDGRMTTKEYLEAVGGSFTTEATFTLDANGNVTSRTDDWGTTTRVFNANNQVTSITWPSAKTATFTYNAAGLLASVTYPNGLLVSYTYDDFNRLIVPARFRSSAGTELTGNAERQNKVTTLGIGLGGTSHFVTFYLDGTGSTTTILRPGNTQTNFTYDTAHRLTAIDHRYLGTTFFKTTLGLNAVGSVLHETREGSALLDPALPLPTTNTFDAANQLKSRGGHACTYDADGNLIAVDDFTATYSPENRPTQIKTGSTTVNYTYDALGQRVKREVVGGPTAQFHYAPSGELLFTTDGAGNIHRCYIWNGKALVAILTGASINPDLRYTHLDRLGNVVALSGTGATVGPQAKYAYQPYGASYAENIPAGGVPEMLFTFVGGLGVQQESGGLYYMQNRFYDSATARFLQRDPAGFEGGINLYAYVAGNPATHSDPTGLDGLFGLPTNPGSSGFEFLINTVWKKPVPTVPGLDSASGSGFEFVKNLFTEQALNAQKAAGQAGGSYGLAGHGSRAAVNTVSELAERKALQSAATTGVEIATAGAETAAAVEETVLATGLRTSVSGGLQLAGRYVVAPWFLIGTGAEIAGYATGSDDVSAAGEAMTGVIWPSSWKVAWDYWTGD